MARKFKSAGSENFLRLPTAPQFLFPSADSHCFLYILLDVVYKYGGIISAQHGGFYEPSQV